MAQALAERTGSAMSGGSASSRIFDELRLRIISLDYPPGTLLSRPDLALEFDVSQTPVRDAIQRLEQEGLVRVYPQSRTLVTKIDVPQIHEAYFLRFALETEVVRKLAREGDLATVERAKPILQMQENIAGERSQIPLLQELDEIFHRTLFAGAGYIGLHALMRSRAGHLDRMRRLREPDAAKIAHILAGHVEILDAIAAGDEAAGAAAIRAHLGKTVANVEDLRAEHPDYFN
ncbi:GntR family transcriptional regulator [Tropicimonas sp.]|uniref:GntR family transcriptional regulator n=1 Tax=Tropicimonas sp. TaxID=2067044 RepID=UPI003A8A045E